MNNQVLISFYDNLSEIYDKNSKKLIKKLSSKYEYYDSLSNEIKSIFENKKENIKCENFSYIEGNSTNNKYNDNPNKPRIIQFKNGDIFLFIPYSQLIPLRKKKV